MVKDWHKIISFNGSQANAFEELVCQLAMNEENKEFKTFERVGTPDGGVECYWELQDGSEWGWQAKYYDDLTSSEWAGIRKSLFAAAETHPKLVKYFIGIPHNLSDGRRGKVTQKETWERHKQKWTADLSAKGRNIEVVLLNSSALLSQLLLLKNSGIKSFFLGEIEIKEEQLFIHLDAAIANLGPKYSPDLNFEIDFLPTVFDALSRNSKFQESFKNKLNTFLLGLNEIIAQSNRFEETKEFAKRLEGCCIEIIATYEKTDFLPQTEIPVTKLLAKIDGIRSELEPLGEVYNQIEAVFQDELKKKREDKKEEYRGFREQKTDREAQALYTLLNTTDELSYYLAGPAIRASNEGVLFLKGKPGSGKSHLLADVATNRKDDQIPTVFLLGEHFSEQHPKINIKQLVGCSGSLESYLATLESLGRAKQVRILFIIDAINEGPGKFSWKNSIAGLVKELTKFKWIGFVFSYRSTYEDVVIPDGFKPPLLIHTGFEGMEYEATKQFFEYYKIQQPTIPLLNPEFSNPLFLKTFCVALNKAGKTIIPEGYEGISRILDAYLEAANKNIGVRLGYPYLKINLVSRAIDNIVQHQIETNEFIISWENAFSLVEPLIKTYSDKRGFLEELIKEGIFIEDQFYNSQSKKYELHGIVFNYERFNEHLKAGYLLSKFSSIEALRKAFSAKGYLRSFFIGEFGFSGSNTGLLNAFAIIIPEQFGVEIYDVFKPRDDWGRPAIYDAFLQSIIWRRHDTIKSSSFDYVRKFINYNDEHLVHFFEIILLLSSNPTNYYNADFIHGLLKPLSVARRDHDWSLMINWLWQRNEKNPIQRIIDWCWSEEDKSYTKDESIILLGKILAWFFTSSNRYIRDKSTKAFASLFINRVHLLKHIIEEFKLVNDPYVLERVLAGSYGAITHSNDLSKNSVLAQYVYNEFFSKRKPPLNVLTRDYGKGIIEFVISKGGKLKYDKINICPPFDYDFPTDIPDKKWLKKIEIKNNGHYTTEEMGQAQIKRSVLHWDFGRYILGSNYGNSTPFASYSIKSRQSFTTLKTSLRGKKKKFLKMYVDSVTTFNGTGELGKKLRNSFSEDDVKFLLEKIKSFIQDSNNFLSQNLSKEELILFESAKAFIADGFETEKYKKKRFNLELVQHYILKKVFDLGWTKKFFGRYDSRVDEMSRSASKPERMGKKYQWIAYYEIMALLTDNFDFIDRYSDEQLPYVGTWQHNFRNIDPSVIIKQKSEHSEDDKGWWLKYSYSNWNEPLDSWLNKFNDIPDFEKIVRIKDKNNIEWYLLYDRTVWKSEKKIGTDHHNADRREFWFDVNALLVDKKTMATLNDQGSKKILWPDTNISNNLNYYDIFLGELYHSGAYNSSIEDYFSKYPYASFRLERQNLDIIHTVEEYAFGSEYDLSENKVRIYKPSKFLFELIGGCSGENDACIYDKDGNVIAYDPGALDNQSKGCFLINKKVLDDCLKKNNLELLWMIFGEKEEIGANISYVHRMLFSGFLSFENNKFKMRVYHEREKSR